MEKHIPDTLSTTYNRKFRKVMTSAYLKIASMAKSFFDWKQVRSFLLILLLVALLVWLAGGPDGLILWLNQ